jgi:branched-chain amino acid transport system permease protein
MDDQRSFSRLKLAGFAALLAVLAAAAWAFSGYQLFRFSLIAVYAIAMLGLDILTGRTGPLSLGHGAFYAIGAYTSAILIYRTGCPYALTLPAAGLVAGAFGFLIGIPSLRLAGIYLALATFALAAAIGQLLKKLSWLTGGVQGIKVKRPTVPFDLGISVDQWLYLLTVLVTIIMFVLGWNMMRGRLGRAFLAIKQSDLAAAASGINVAAYKTLSFGISAFYAGVAGGLLAILVGFVAPDMFDFFLSVSFLAGIMIGGLGTVSGSLIGAGFVVLLPDYAQKVSQSLPWAVYGAVLMFVIIVMPSGVVGTLRRVFHRMKSGRSLEMKKQGIYASGKREEQDDVSP